MAFYAIPFHWVCVAFLLVAMCANWPELSSHNDDRDGLTLLRKRSPRNGDQGVFQGMQRDGISSLSEVFGFLPGLHDFAILVILAGAQGGGQTLARTFAYPHPRVQAHACVGEGQQIEMPGEVDQLSVSSDLIMWLHEPKFRTDRNPWQNGFAAAQKRTKSDTIFNSEHERESIESSENHNVTKNSEFSLSRDRQELQGLIGFLLAIRKEGREWTNKTLMAMLIIARRLLEALFAALMKRKQPMKTGIKLVSMSGPEDLLLDEELFKMREELSAKNWRRNKTASALWNCKLPRFEKNRGSTTLWVAPATLGQFLPTVVSGQADRFQYMGYRLASLAALPSGSAVSPLRLAEAGFHYNPEASTSAVVCHECGVTYRLDSPSATLLPPLLHHQGASPSCNVARSLMEVYGSSLRVKPSGDATQPQRLHAGDECETGLQTDGPTDMTDSGETPSVSRTDSATRAEVSEQRRTDMVPSQGFNGYTMALPSTSQDVQRYPGAMAVPSTNPGSSEKVYLDLNSAVYPLFSSLQSRLATFSKWPAASFRPPELLAPLGFFYAGYADCIRCFYCGIGLKTWEENDDPEEEHIRWRPNCQYVLATKGRRFVDRTLARLNQSGNNTDDAIDGQSSAARDTRSSASQRSAPSHTTGGELSTQDYQQLLQMGFSEEMIGSTQARLLASGQTLTVENMLALLVP